MKAFFWACFALLIPGLLLRIPIGGAGILSTDIFVPAFAVVWVFYRLLIRRSLPFNSLILPGSIFMGVAVLSFLVGVSELDTAKEMVLSFSYTVRFLSMLCFGWAASDLFASAQDQQTYFRNLFVISGIVIFLGFVQFFLIPDISQWSTEGGWDPHIGRLLGTWLDPNFVGGFIGFLTPFLVGYWYDCTRKRVKIALGVLIVVFLGALFLTFSRSGYLSAGMGLCVFFLVRDPKIILLGIICAGVGIASNERAQKRVEELVGTVSAVVFRETDEVDPTASLRLRSWQQSFRLFEKYPVLGIGYNTYRYRAADEGIVDETYFSSGGSDSTHLTVLITTGVLGFVPFLWFFGRLWWKPLRWYFRTRQALFLGFSCGVVSLFIHAFFVNSLLFPFLFLPLVSLYSVLENRFRLLYSQE